MLFSFLLTNDEARKYLMLKFQSRTLETLVFIEQLKRPLRKVGVNKIVNMNPNNLENIWPLHINNTNMYVIDLEDSC